MRSALPMVLAVATVCVALPSQAQADNPLVGEGAELYDELRFEEALQVLSAALIRPGNTTSDEMTIYRLLAFTYLALGRNEEAEGAYRRLLVLEPEFTPGNDVSPRFREFLDSVKARWEAEGRPGTAVAPASPVEIEHVSPPQGDRNEPVRLSARLVDPDRRVASLVLAYRQGTNDVFRRLDTEEVDGEYVATIPGDDVRPPLVEYYFEALDDGGLPVAARGDVAAPLRIAVEAPSSGSVFTKWWFWTAAVVVVGGAVTAAVLLSRGGGNESQGTLVIGVSDMP